MKKITTVRGEIAPEELGFTTIHEHVLGNLTFMRDQLGFIPPIPKEMLRLVPENYSFLRSGASIFSEECSAKGDVDYLIKELRAFKRIGGNAVCDASPIGFRGDVYDMKNASEQAGVHIICATGLYNARAQPEEYANKSENELITCLTREIREGIDGTGIKPGFIKCALNDLNPDNTIHERELKTLRACARTAAETGLSLHVHTAVPLTCDHILHGVEIAVNECGMWPDKLYMMHLDAYLRTPANIADYYSNIETVRSVNTDLQTKVLEKGVTIGFDSWGMLVSIVPDDYDRIKGLVDLLKKGYASQIVLGHDVYDKSRGVTYGYTGFTGFAGFALPILKELGFNNEINKLTIDNPARLLAY